MTRGAVRLRATFALVLTAVLWSSGGLLLKLIPWEPLSILSARSMVAAIVFLIYLRPLKPKWTPLQIVGAFAYVVAQLSFITATKLTTAANAVFLHYTSPIYIILMGSWLLGERPRRVDWISLFSMLLGILLFFSDDLSLTELSGNISGIISGLAMAVFVISMRKQKEGSPAYTILLGNTLNAFIGLPSLVQESVTFSSLGMVLYLGLFQIGLSFILYSIAIRHLRAFESTLVLSLELVLNPLWVFLAIGEVPGRLALVGSVLILGAAVTPAIAASRVDIDDGSASRLT